MNQSTKNIGINYLKPLILILGALGFLFSANPQTSQVSYLFCLNPSVQPFSISVQDDGYTLDNIKIEKFLKENGVTRIEKWIPQATENDYDGNIYLNRIYRAYIERASNEKISELISLTNSQSEILYAENEFIRKPLYSPNDPLTDVQCSLNSVKATQAWDFWDIPSGLFPEGREVLLASVDTGVDYTHPDLQNNSWINQAEIPEWMAEAGLDSDNDGYIEAEEVVDFLIGEGMDINGDGSINLRDAVSDGSPFEDFEDNDNNGYADDLLGWDPSGWYGTDDNDPFPKEDVASNGTWAHGTHVAGILSAVSDNEYGMASVAYNAKIISVKGSRENQSGEPGINDGYAGILYAAKAGYYSGTFTIINNSWGGGGYSGSENATINTAFNTYGAIVVCAAGNGDENSGSQEYGAHYPSSYENAVGVCAMGCSYSWGNWATYHYSVDLAAPGENIHSAIIGSSFEAWDGSSMASPNAASCFGLLKAYYPSWSNQELMDRMYMSADRRVYEVNPEYETCNGNSGDDCFGHGMVDVYKAIGMNFSPYLMIDAVSVEMIADDDQSLNPGEAASLIINLENEIGWTDADNVTAVLSTTNPHITMINNSSEYGEILNGNIQSPLTNFNFAVSESIDLGSIDFNLMVYADGSDGYLYSNSLDFDVEVSLFQNGFPYDTNSELKSAPVVADFDNDGDNEVVFADQNGEVRMIKDGVEVENSIFPFDTGNQVWGAISSADLDSDGFLDFVVASKSKSIYIFDIYGLKSEYDADRYLIGTPVIGNFDSDSDLEIAVGGYSGSTSSNSLFVINYDGTDVDGFPYVVGEKIKAGAAVADMDGNGIDDIIFGTDSDNLHVVLDSSSPAPNFPVSLSDRIQSEPAVLDLNGDKIILTGCKDNNFYAINYNDGSLRFLIPTADDVFTSPSFSNNLIYFGSDDGYVYAVDTFGNIAEGFPLGVEDEVVGSIVFADLIGDGSACMITGTSGGKVFAFDSNNDLLQYFPIEYQYPIASSPTVVDFDNDGDMEIVLGTTGDLMMIDMKNDYFPDSDFWSLFKGDNARTGYFSFDGGGDWSCGTPASGDINCDEIINILDIVSVVNMVIGSLDNYSDYELWSADVNQDEIINILDIVSIVNIVISE